MPAVPDKRLIIRRLYKANIISLRVRMALVYLSGLIFPSAWSLTARKNVDIGPREESQTIPVLVKHIIWTPVRAGNKLYDVVQG